MVKISVIIIIISKQKIAICIVNKSLSFSYNNIVLIITSYIFSMFTKAKKLLSSFIDYFKLHTFLAE